MSSSQTADIPLLSGGIITIDTIKNETQEKSRRTKIVCTLGPACWEVPQLEELIECGMSVARFNFSHGDHGGHQACLDRLRQAAANKNSHVGEYNFMISYQSFDIVDKSPMAIESANAKWFIFNFICHLGIMHRKLAQNILGYNSFF
jgi:hypothetical protein